MKTKLLAVVNFLLITLAATWLINMLYSNIQKKLSENIEVVNLYSLYKEQGYPVYTKEVTRSEVAYFVTDITLIKSTNSTTSYSAFLSHNKASTIKTGNKVYIPRNEDTLKAGFSWVETEQYIIGKVSSISSQVDWKTGLYKINVEVKEELSAQPFYAAKMVNAIKKDILVVPTVNLDNKEEAYSVWLEDDNAKAVQRDIKVGICDGYNCEVIDGISAGDRIITSDRKLLTEGMLLNNRGENI